MPTSIHVNQAKRYSFYEPVWREDGKVAITRRVMWVSNVWGDSPPAEAAAKLAARYGVAPINFCEDLLPWYVGLSSGSPPISIPEKNLVVDTMPIPDECLSRYVPIAYNRKVGWLMYFTMPSMLHDSHTYHHVSTTFAEREEIKPHTYKSDLTNNVMLDEKLLMETVIQEAADMSLRTRLNYMKSHPWVGQRITDWTDGFALPPQWMVYSAGMVMQRARWTRTLGGEPPHVIWDAMWIGKRF